MTKNHITYPVGQQSFEQLRLNGDFYIDKTRFIDKIVNRSRYYFLGRPRRFGKSLFLSALQCFFEGKRHLFKGLYIDSVNRDWEPYPVLKIDLNIGKYRDSDNLADVLDTMLTEWELKYDISRDSDDEGMRFRKIIKTASEKTGRTVVVLVDEYDKPLVSNLHNKELFDKNRTILGSLYSNFKSQADYLRMVFLTGVSRFSRLSVFSDLNNIFDISLLNDYSDICGISEEELTTHMSQGISDLADTIGESYDETLRRLKHHYDGYRFSEHGKEIYNPYSIMCVMESRSFENFWISSGEPTILWELLKDMQIDLESMIHTRCSIAGLRGLDLDNPIPSALFYQTGYLTIKSVAKMGSHTIYTLGIPNKEVEEGFFSYLLPKYANLRGVDSMFYVADFVSELKSGNVVAFMKRLTSFFASISYQMRMEEELNVHNALLVLMKLVGLDVRTELATSDGRIDLFIRTERYYYIMEVKLDGSAREALDQINRKEYTLPFEPGTREIIKIGIDFTKEKRRPAEWLMERD